jgi:transcriptional regulator with XRE-family HTH domain
MKISKHELTNDPIVLRIIQELNMQGKTGKELEREVGISNGMLTKWKYQGSKSYMNYIGKIADFLNVTAEYLQGIPEKQKSDMELNAVEVKLIRMFRKMGSGERKCMLQSAEYFANSSELRKYKVEIESRNESNSDENLLS